MTKEQLKYIMPGATAENIEKYFPWLNMFMERMGINTPLRQIHFLSQLAHESGCLRYVREIASGSAYEGRKDLGNIHPGDGVKYKGRGLIQLTGRTNYSLYNHCFPDEIDIVEYPEFLEQPMFAVHVSCWFWKTRNLNALADKDDMVAVTKRINGGTNGLTDRRKYYENAKKVLL